MANAYSVEISGQRYQGSTASAKAQFEALHIAGRTGLVAMLKTDASEMSMVALILQIPFADVQRLIDLMVKDCITRESDSVPVAENLFRDAIQDYYLLLAHALRENLAGFWQLRRPADKAAAERTPLNPHIDWFLWRPCVGVPGLCGPLARWADMLDGTYTLEDVQMMHSVMDELLYQRERASG